MKDILFFVGIVLWLYCIIYAMCWLLDLVIPFGVF